jgi:phage terminase large subunit-like protein
MPERTLAWGIVNFWVEYVRSPDGNGVLMPTLEQMRFLAHWYSVDEQGKWNWRNGVCRRAKGTGKTPFAAAIALAELCGPVVFDHFDQDGDPVGKRHPAAWVTFAGVSQEQSKNCYSLFPLMVSPKMKRDFGIEVNRTILYTKAGGRLEAVTSSAHTMEGNRPTLVLEDEIQWWTSANGGHDLRSVIDGNITKVRGARRLSLCNAHIPGEDSVAERDYDYYQLVQQGRAVDTGLMYDSIEAPADTPLSEIPSQAVDPKGYEAGVAKLREGLEVARGDATWLDLDEVTKAILDVRTPVSEGRRRHLNQINASDDALVSPTEWDACAVPGAQLEPGDRITLAFDGSKSNDWSALVACRIEDSLIVPIAVWNPNDNPDGEINRMAVDNTVRAAFEKYDVVGFRADVREFESYVDMWERDFKRKLRINARPGHIVNWDMRGCQKNFTLACEKFLDAIVERELKHNADPTLRQHVLNSKRFPQPWGGMSLRKESRDSSRKIDAAVCAVMAYSHAAEWRVSKRGNRTGKAMVVK